MLITIVNEDTAPYIVVRREFLPHDTLLVNAYALLIHLLLLDAQAMGPLQPIDSVPPYLEPVGHHRRMDHAVAKCWMLADQRLNRLEQRTYSSFGAGLITLCVARLFLCPVRPSITDAQLLQHLPERLTRIEQPIGFQ